MRLAALARVPTRSAASSRAAATSGSSAVSKKPNIASLPPWYSSQRRSSWALIRPTASPSRSARKYSASACSNQGFLPRSRNSIRSKISGATHCGWSRCRWKGTLTKRFSSRRVRTGLIDTFPMGAGTYTLAMSETAKCPGRRLREGAQPRPPRAARSGQGARPPPLLPPAHLAGRPGGRDGGARDDHARLQQLPRADRRRAGQAGRARRAGDLRHRRHRLAPAERDDPAARRPRARAGRVDGDRGRDRLHHRLPGEPRLHRDDPRARRHGDLRLRRPRLDPRRLPALRRQAAPLPPQPDGQAGEDAAARGARTAAASWSSSTASSRWRATSATCRGSSSSARPTARG